MLLIVGVLEKKCDGGAEKEPLLFQEMRILPLWSVTWVKSHLSRVPLMWARGNGLNAMQNVKLPGLLWRALACRWTCTGCGEGVGEWEAQGHVFSCWCWRWSPSQASICAEASGCSVASCSFWRIVLQRIKLCLKELEWAVAAGWEALILMPGQGLWSCGRVLLS